MRLLYWVLIAAFLLLVVAYALWARTCFGCQGPMVDSPFVVKVKGNEPHTLYNLPSSESPFNVDKHTRIRQNKTTYLFAGFYNQDDESVNIIFNEGNTTITCMDDSGVVVPINLYSLPLINVPAGDAVRVGLVLNASSKFSGTVVCPLSVFNANTEKEIYGRLHFYLEIVD